MKSIRKQAIPFWSFNDKLDKEVLFKEIRWMKKQGYGGFFMHARSGLNTEYLSDAWFDCITSCVNLAKSLGMQAWLYDENGFPSGFAGGKLLNDAKNLENYLTFSFGAFDKTALAVYDVSSSNLIRVSEDNLSVNLLNVYKHTSISTVDVLDDKVVDKFIQETHEVYNERFGGRISDSVSGFFTDEPQYYGYGTPFPHLISDFFKNNYGIDILDRLGLLFVEKDGFEDFRYKYYSACQKLFLENYSEKIYNWCSERNIMLTGHYIEEADLSKQMFHCAGIMPFYEYEHIPAIDWLCRRFMSVVPIKQLVSAAHQLNKKDVMTECFAMTGWDVTPLELKAIAEFQYIYGVNMMCNHLLPYSETGFRKNDYPVHFSKTNAWAEDVMPLFNDYFDKLGSLIRNSVEYANVAVLHPIRSAYITFKHDIFDEHDASLIEFCDELAENDIPFHFLDETLLERHGEVSGEFLRCGEGKYSVVILPPDILSISKTTDALLKKFVKNGGKLIVSGKTPAYLEGMPCNLDYLVSNYTMDELKANRRYFIIHDGGKIRSALRSNSDFSFISVLNIDEKNKADCKINLKEGKIKQLNIITNEISDCSEEFVLNPLESKFFVVCSDAVYVKRDNKEIIDVKGEFDVVSFTDNYCVLDMAELSFDGVNYSNKYFIAAIFDKLLKDRYDGEIYLKFTFDCNFIPNDLKLMYEHCQDAFITVNGNTVTFNERSEMDNGFLLGNISDYIEIGKNVIIEKMRFFQKDSVYFALFGKNVTESLKNCMVYDTFIDVLRLVGSFGVYEKDGLKETELENVFVGKNFVLDKPAAKVCDLVHDGFLFFAGKIVLKKLIKVTSMSTMLRLVGRVHYAKVFVNGRFAGECLFNHTLDVSEFITVGDNLIEIELTTGSRNLFGPFHDKVKQETFYATPRSFSFFGQWDEFQCENYTDSYFFIRTGLFDFDGQFRLSLDY